MIKRFINWLRGSHQKRSEGILKTFNTVNTELQKLNTEIVNEQSRNYQKLAELQQKNEALSKVLVKNYVVSRNIANFLGEAEAEVVDKPSQEADTAAE